jgi:hypothetical protein
MGAHAGPKVVTTSAPTDSKRIVFSVDFANRLSYSGSGNDVINLANNKISGVFNTSPSFSKTNSGEVDFNGTTQFIYFPNDSNLNLQELTISSWVRPDFYSTNGHIFEKGYVNQSYSLFLEGQAILFRQSIFGMGLLNLSAASSLLSNTKPNHIAATFTSNTRTIYVNGNQVAQNTMSVNIINTSNYGQTMGSYNQVANSNGYYFDGAISAVSVYNYAMTPDEIRQNYRLFKSRFGL